MLSWTRIDPIPGIYNLRIYGKKVDPLLPLCEEMSEYTMVATVIVSGFIATVTACTSESLALLDTGKWADFDRQLLKLGVTEVHWERHKNGRVKLIKRRVRGQHDN